MAVPALRDSTSGATSSGTNPFTITCNVPSGRQSGDLLVLLVAEDIGRTVDGNPGWEIEYGSGAFQAYAKISDGTETTAQVSYNGASINQYWCGAFSGVAAGAADAFVRTALFTASGTTTADCPDLTATADDTLVLRVYQASGLSDCDTPSGYTPILSQSGDPTLYIFTKNDGVSAGSVGVVSLTGLNSTRSKFCTTLAVQPSSAVAPTISSVTLTGTSQISNTLTATVVTDQDPVDSTAYQWQKSNSAIDEVGTDLSGTSQTLALSYSDFADLLDADADNVYVRCQAIATKSTLASAEDASDWQLVSIPSEVSAGGGSLLESSLIR